MEKRDIRINFVRLKIDHIDKLIINNNLTLTNLMSDLSRRDFLKKSGIALAGMMVAPTIVPASVLGKSAGYTAPSDKLNILGVGIGGRGAADLAAMETENIIGLCDCDWKYAMHIFDK